MLSSARDAEIECECECSLAPLVRCSGNGISRQQRSGAKVGLEQRIKSGKIFHAVSILDTSDASADIFSEKVRSELPVQAAWTGLFPPCQQGGSAGAARVKSAASRSEIWRDLRRGEHARKLIVWWG